jgi:hypothetical protein
MLSRAYEWPLQAKFAESSLARRVPLSQQTPHRSTPITTMESLPFEVRLHTEGAMNMPLKAYE